MQQFQYGVRRTIGAVFLLASAGAFGTACDRMEPGEDLVTREQAVRRAPDHRHPDRGRGQSDHHHPDQHHSDHDYVRLASGCGDHADQDELPSARKEAAKKVHWKARGRKSSGKQCRSDEARIKILGFNDFHGQLSAGRLVAGRPVGGAAVLASYLNAASASAEDGALIVHAGDHVGASPAASALLQDEPSITFLNLLANKHCKGAAKDSEKCNIVGTFGNHEFDEGKDEALRLVFGGNHESGPFLDPDYDGAKFSYVLSNVIDDATGKTILPPYVIRKVGKVQVGIIGAVLKETPTIVTPTGVAGLTFLDEADAINKAVKELEKKKIKTIGVTIHQGASQTSYTGATNPDAALSGSIVDIVNRLDAEVDFVVSGHAHGFTNALVPNAGGEPVIVTQAFSASTAYGEIDLTVDLSTGDVVEKSASIVTTYADEAPGNAPDAKVLALVAAAEEATAPLVNQVIATATSDILRAESAAGESALGNLIADSQRAATGAQIAFMNPGGIRADLFGGEVTWGELFTIQPFGNSLVTLDLTGQQIVTLLNQQWAPPQTFPRILKTSGISYVWDPSIPATEDRIVSVLVDGQPLDLQATYRVVVNNFIAAGGDNFTVLTSGLNPVGGDVDLDALINYVKALPQPFGAAIEGRIQNP